MNIEICKNTWFRKINTKANKINTEANKINTKINKIKKLPALILLTVAVIILTCQGAYAAMTLTAFTASPDTDSKVKLDWSSVPGAQTYLLLRRVGSGAISTVADIDVDSSVNPLTYIDTSLQADTEYTYIIEAYSNDDPGVLLDSKSAVVATTAMIAPYNVKSVYDINSRSVALTWKSSALATDCVIFHYDEEDIIDTYNAGSTTGTEIFLSSLVPQGFSLMSVDAEGSNSMPVSVNVTPIEAPVLSIATAEGVVTISWAEFSQIGQFQLERSKWNGVLWDDWTVVKSMLSGHSTSDIPPTGGNFRYRLAAKSGSKYKGYSSISETISGLPAPSSLVLEIADSGINKGIHLSWVNGLGNEAAIQVRRKVGSGSFLLIETLDSLAEAYFDEIPLTAGTVYTYQVRSYADASNYSASVEKGILAALPTAPSSLHANVLPEGITLSWRDNSVNESGFSIERLTDTGTFAEIAVTDQNITFYTDTAVIAGQNYIYRVRAHNALGKSLYTNEVTIDAWDTIAPATLTVTPVSDSRLDLMWSYTGASGYSTIIERKTGTDGAWAVIQTTASGSLKYSDAGLSPNTRYFYRVRKSLGAGASGASYPNDNIGKGASTLLGKPSLSGSAGSGNTIYLTWSAGTSGAEIIIERKMPNGGFSALETAGSSTTGWYDNTGLIPGAAYTYRIKARNLANESLYSNELTVNNLYLEAPSFLSASVNQDLTIKLNWIDNSNDETGFEIWRYEYGSGAYRLYATVERNVTTYLDTLIDKGVQYNYMVRAYIASGNMYSPYSNAASVGAGLVNPPTNLRYTYISAAQVKLDWDDNSDNESGFKVEWRIGQNGTWNVYAWLSPNITAYTLSNLNTATKYYFRVRAYSYTGNADSLSNEILVSTAIPLAPSEIKLTALSSSRVKIDWKDHSDNETGFRILRKASNGISYRPVAEVDRDISSYTDSNLSAGTKYFYKVAAYSKAGSSESKAAEIKTNLKATFTDLASVASWAKEAIESLAGMGIIKGATSTSYKPDNKITKAEFTAIIIRAFKLDTVPIGSLADVRLNMWFYKDVMIAENFGIIEGDKNNRFYPNADITREEIAIILFKALETSGRKYTGYDNTALEKFADKNMISPHAIASMASLVGEGIIEGISGNTIGAKYTATRAQAAVFVYRALNKTGE